MLEKETTYRPKYWDKSATFPSKLNVRFLVSILKDKASQYHVIKYEI